VPKLKKGDLVRARLDHPSCKGLAIEVPHGARGFVKVLWMTGYWKGERTWESPDYLTKMEVESA
jgi:hypothetical protein